MHYESTIPQAFGPSAPQRRPGALLKWLKRHIPQGTRPIQPEECCTFQGKSSFESKGKLAVFAGTGDGHVLCRHLLQAGVEATVFVATEYGKTSFSDLSGLEVVAGQLDEPAMCAILPQFGTVVDATHPYAIQVSRNLKAAAEKTGIRYLRLVRPETEAHPNTVVVSDVPEAVAYLANTQGNVMLTTGSKELAAYTALPDFAQRLYVRVLPDPRVVRHCLDLGFAPSHLICMQGPFSHEMNTALLRSVEAKWLVTKNSGAVGGLLQKLTAAQETQTQILMIARPIPEEEGYTLEQLCLMLTECSLVSEAAPAPHSRSPRSSTLPISPALWWAVVRWGAGGVRSYRDSAPNAATEHFV